MCAPFRAVWLVHPEQAHCQFSISSKNAKLKAFRRIDATSLRSAWLRGPACAVWAATPAVLSYQGACSPLHDLVCRFRRSPMFRVHFRLARNLVSLHSLSSANSAAHSIFARLHSGVRTLWGSSRRGDIRRRLGKVATTRMRRARQRAQLEADGCVHIPTALAGLRQPFMAGDITSPRAAQERVPARPTAIAESPASHRR
jgi:hypothetical protein